ncbi:O-methyltransferase [Anaerostipes sp.]|uniref:O-methyltransferase n=1 Tax=Anaerostipes sp. TaxID=1872530 RepID=UPI0025BEA6B3|nr:O-methyltransferase [Anaerostipes sp.]MBS7009416.1 O-methyltransferase [Anaerostipes sp.]
MIVNENVTDYLRSLIKEEDVFLSGIERQARKDHVPIVKPETKEFLKVLVMMNQPMKILEVGTAVGFSSLYMHKFQPEGGTVVTIERNEGRIQKAKENFLRAGAGDAVTLLEGDAAEILAELSGTFDLIFMDAAKGQYIRFFEHILRLLPSGGVLVSDNVLQDGDIVKSRYAIERRDRTIHKRMREYLYTLKNHSMLDTSILPLGDGVAVSIKTGE